MSSCCAHFSICAIEPSFSMINLLGITRHLFGIFCGIPEACTVLNPFIALDDGDIIQVFRRKAVNQSFFFTIDKSKMHSLFILFHIAFLLVNSLKSH